MTWWQYTLHIAIMFALASIPSAIFVGFVFGGVFDWKMRTRIIATVSVAMLLATDILWSPYFP